MDDRRLRTALIERLAAAGVAPAALARVADAVSTFIAEEYTMLPQAKVIATRLGAGRAIVVAAWNRAPNGDGLTPATPIAALVCDTHGAGMGDLATAVARTIAHAMGDMAGVQATAVEEGGPP